MTKYQVKVMAFVVVNVEAEDEATAQNKAYDSVNSKEFMRDCEWATETVGEYFDEEDKENGR
jgi:hypothetical protein